MWAATLINVLHHKFVVDATRLANWLGELADMSQKPEKMAPSKLGLHKYFHIHVFGVLASVLF